MTWELEVFMEQPTLKCMAAATTSPAPLRKLCAPVNADLIVALDACTYNIRHSPNTTKVGLNPSCLHAEATPASSPSPPQLFHMADKQQAAGSASGDAGGAPVTMAEYKKSQQRVRELVEKRRMLERRLVCLYMPPELLVYV